MALTIPNKVSEHGIPVAYWVLRGFAVRDEIVKSQEANNVADLGPLRPVPGTPTARVRVLQLQFDGHADKESADKGFRPLAQYVFDVAGERACRVWAKLKTGEESFPVLYEILKEQVATAAGKGIVHPFAGHGDV